jgi:hypothetical protein
VADAEQRTSLRLHQLPHNPSPHLRERRGVLLALGGSVCGLCRLGCWRHVIWEQRRHNKSDAAAALVQRNYHLGLGSIKGGTGGWPTRRKGDDKKVHNEKIQSPKTFNLPHLRAPSDPAGAATDAGCSPPTALE